MSNTTLLNKYSCNICGSGKELLVEMLTPSGTKRGLKVYACGMCGLLQSLPRIDHVPYTETSPSMSCLADFGNVRYGKGFRADKAKEILRPYLTSNNANVLDVGSSRGAFLDMLDCLSLDYDLGEVWAIEPDTRLPKYTPDFIDKYSFFQERLERQMLPKDFFDVVHCSHTLEHLRNPLEGLKHLARSMKDTGVLYLEVPRLEYITEENFVEEWFIDKHLYHFSVVTLKELICKAGFRILEQQVTDENIIMLLQPAQCVDYLDMTEFNRAADVLITYTAKRLDTIKRMHLLIDVINEKMKQGNVAVWGAGRIFDAMLILGLDSYALQAVVDTNLYGNHCRTGLLIRHPNSIVDEQPDIIVVCSRTYRKEIEGDIRGKGIKSKLMFWDDKVE